MSRPPHPAGSERGIALLMALLTMVVLILAAGAFLMGVNVETKISGRNVRTTQALNLAEAGVAEAAARLRSGEIPNNGNPRMVTQIFLASGGLVPVMGADTVALATAQPEGEWLRYSAAERGSDVLTVTYKTDANRAVIYRYDASKNPAVQTASGQPIFVISSTGRRGVDQAKVVTEVVPKPITASAKAALAANVGINFSGNSDVCGYDHKANTPDGTKGRGPCAAWEQASGHLPGAWSTGSITTQGSSAQYGSPSPYVQNQTGFYQGPWEVVGMSQSEFYTWVGTPTGTEPSPPKGLFYLDNNTTAQDASGSWAYHGGTGEGMLYVDGDMTVNGNFVYRGLIYVEGDLKINGTCWILGAMIVKGKTTIKIANGNCCILYSSDALKQNLSKFGGPLVTLSWREVR